jgi:hypothetical protein
MKKSLAIEDSVFNCGPGIWFCNAVTFHFWDQNLNFGRTYRVYNGFLYCATGNVFLSSDLDSGMYIDSGRALERFLLCYLSKSKIVDTILFFEPLTNWIPDSMFDGCTILSVLPVFDCRFFVSGRTQVLGVHDLCGRKRRNADVLRATKSSPSLILIEQSTQNRVISTKKRLK